MTRPIPPPWPGRFDLRVAGLVLVSLVVFAGAVGNEFVWDDIAEIRNNVHLGEPGYWWNAIHSPFPYMSPEDQARWGHGMYRPFISLVSGAEYSIWGRNPVAYHLANLVLHAGIVVLVFGWVLRRLAPLATAGTAAAMAAMVFAVHPARAESVGWICGRTDLWMTFWVLVGLAVWDKCPGWKGAVATELFLLLGFASKENAVLIPFVLGLDGLLRLQKSELRTHLLRTAILWPVSCAALVLRLWMVPLGGQGAPRLEWTTLPRAVLASLGGYLRTVVWPWRPSTQAGLLSADLSLDVTLGIAGLLAAVTLAALARHREALRPWLADVLWFVIPLTPNLLPFNPRIYFSERDLYLPSLGIAALAGRGILAGLQRSPSSRRRVLAGMSAVCAAFALGAATHARHFSSNEALWRAELRLRPTDTFSLMNLSRDLTSRGRYDEATKLVGRAIPGATDEPTRAELFGEWLELEFQSVTADPARMQALRADLDAIAAHRPPAGETAGLFESLAEESRDKLRRSGSFRVLRATATAAGGALETARDELEAIHVMTSTAHGDAMWSRAVSILVATFVTADAMHWLQGCPDPALRARLGSLVTAVQTVADARLPPGMTEARLGSLLVAEGDPVIALTVLRRALQASPDEVAVLVDAITVEAQLHQFSAARRDVVHLRPLNSALAAECERIVSGLITAG